MTAPTITYGHGTLEDAWNTLADDYTLTASGSTGTTGVTASHDLYINVTVFVGAPYVSNDTNLALSTNSYPKIMFRYKTSGNAQARIVVEYSDASTDEALAAVSAAAWTVGSYTLDAAKTLDHVHFYSSTGTGTVYYDFFLVYAGTFTFPQYTRLNWDMMNRYSNTGIPSRIGRRKSWMGADETIVMLEGDVDSDRASWKRTLDTNAAQVLEDIHHRAYTEAWQWFTSDRAAFKAVMEHLSITETQDQNYLYSFSMMLSEYRLGKGQDDTLKERFKIG